MIDTLIEKGYIIKLSPDIKKSENSIRLAENSIGRAQVEFDADIYDGAFLSAYTAMFHCARSLLFKDGFKEKNHYALYAYLSLAYVGKIDKKYINELNNFRTIRHKIIYGDEEVHIREVQETEAHSAINIAAGFLESVKKLIHQNDKVKK